MGLKGPDVILSAPPEMLEPGGLYAPNREGVAAVAKKRRRRVVEEELGGIAEYHRFLVRTALIRSDTWHRGESPTMESAANVAAIVQHLAHTDQEHMVVLAANAKMELQAIHEVAVGGTTNISLEKQHLVKIVMLTSARFAFMVHSHPSGHPQPSQDDARMTVEAYKAMDCVGAILVDHVIVAGKRYFSFRDAALWDDVEAGRVPTVPDWRSDRGVTLLALAGGR